MPEITKHAPGTLCWADLGTTDVAAAKAFYAALAGWTFRDMPIGPGQVYSMAQIGGKDVCAIYKQMDDQAKMGVPPHWQPYIAVDSADAACSRAAAAGGRHP